MQKLRGPLNTELLHYKKGHFNAADCTLSDNREREPSQNIMAHRTAQPYSFGIEGMAWAASAAGTMQPKHTQPA